MSKDLSLVEARGGKRARAGLRAWLEGPRLDLLNMAGQPWDSPPPVSICLSAGQRRSWVVPRVEAVLSGRHEQGVTVFEMRIARGVTATRGTDGEGGLSSIKKARRNLVDLRS